MARHDRRDRLDQLGHGRRGARGLPGGAAAQLITARELVERVVQSASHVTVPSVAGSPGHNSARSEADLGTSIWATRRTPYGLLPDGLVECLVQDDEQGIAHRPAETRVEGEHRHVFADGEGPAHLVQAVGHLPVEGVDADHERKAGPLEVVHGRVAVVDPAGVHHDERAQGALDQVVPHEREAGLARRAEDVELQRLVDGEHAEVHRDGRGGLHGAPGRDCRCPTDAEVISASVVSGEISEMAPTVVVLPTPKPPATMIFTGTGAFFGRPLPTRAVPTTAVR